MNVIVVAEKGSHTKEVQAVLSLQSVYQMSRKEGEVVSPERAKLAEYAWVERVHLAGMVGYVPIIYIYIYIYIYVAKLEYKVGLCWGKSK